MRTGRVMGSLVGASVSAVLLLAATVATSHAAAVTLTGSGPDGRSASVNFDNVLISSTHYLKVTLTNTATYDSRIPTEILTAIFFSMPGNPSLTPALAAVFAPDSIKNGPAVPLDVGGEWAYNNGLNVSGFNQGISSTGLNLFGPGDRFNTSSNLEGPDSPDGVQYGITTDNDTAGNDNGGISGKDLIKNSVVFYLGGISSSFSPSASITSVRFQYGTSLAETWFGSGGHGGSGGSARVPYPSSLALLGFGLIGAVLIARRRVVLARVRG